MAKLSIIIPSYNESYLNKTLESILENAVGDFEVIVHVDKGSPGQEVKDDRIIYHYPKSPQGMRAGINYGLEHSQGDYIMKVDAHCTFAKGFDQVLTENMEDNWLVVPRRYSLNADGWTKDERMPIKDYHYLSYPKIYTNYGYCMFPQEWKQRTYERIDPKYDIDDTMTLQGSCYFANKKYFMERVGFLDDDPKTYSTFSCEPLEVGLMYWLGGGEVKVNKKTWYAHLFKNKNYYKGNAGNKSYKKNLKALAGNDWAGKHWMRNEEPGMMHPISWLVEKFWPVPTWPPEREKWTI